MKENLDTILIELRVTAVQMEPRIWMQGHLELLINAEKPYSEGDLIDTEVLLKSLESDGDYFIFSCCCGIPACSGWTKGIHVIHHGRTTKWTDPNTNRTWHLDRDKIENDLRDVREEVKIFKQYFEQKQIEYVGVGCNW